MDKNFINIDDLVRQRLGGGEEPERAGAWLQMRELLDEEMPRKGGVIFWRRLFGAIAVLILLSSISIGGYIYTANRNGDGTPKGNSSDNNNAAASNTTSGDLALNVSSSQTSITEINSSKQISTVATSGHLSVTDNGVANKEKAGKITPIVKQANKQILASNSTTSDNATASDNSASSQHSKQNDKPHTAKNDPNFLPQLIAANERSKQKGKNGASPIIAGANKSGNKTLPSGFSHTHGSTVHSTNKPTNAIAKAGTAAGRSHNDQQTNGMAGVARGRHSASHQKSALMGKSGNSTNSPVTNKTGLVNVNDLALSSNTSGSKNITRANASSAITSNKAITSNATVSNTINSTKNAVNSSASNTRLSSAANKKTGGIKSKTPSATASIANTNSKNPAIAKKDEEAAEVTKQPIVRLQLSEHVVITPTGETYYKLDTTSIETISQQLGLNKKRAQSPVNGERNAPGMPGGSLAGAPGIASAGSPGIGAPNNSGNANTTGTNISGNNSAAQSASNPNILPAASASATGQSGMGIKETQTSKMGGGASTAEKLTATFNDVKFHVASARFAAGLTAGINGTFFGPASFKGFQFGVTGNLSFGDDFSILTELKYFDRINNNYSLNDNYYTYAPAGGGQYTKTVNPLSYSFSTLHSIELPISIRYCKSHFNFYVGGNIVYTFAINTGASTLAATTQQPTVVSAAGNNTEPSIKANDFDSRFGLGYLFGISYQISPSVMLDFRNVQTVWNNASTPGAKIISNQLYKSPSLQVSIGYRFGGNKDKGKDQ